MADEVEVEVLENWDYALTVRDVRLCHNLANDAPTSCDKSVISPLCHLASTRIDLWQYLSGERQAWRWARIAAINALVRIGAPEALPYLISTLSDPDPHIRESITFGLPSFGKQALPHLRSRLRDCCDWTVQEIQAILGILKEIGDPSAVPELSRVIEQQLPIDPARWARQTFAWPLHAVLFTLLIQWFVINSPVRSTVVATGMQPWLESSTRIALGIVPMSLIYALLAYILLVCAVSLPLLNCRAVHERAKITKIALETLATIGDKRPLPQVVSLALSPDSALASTAKETLLSMLLQITPDDKKNLSIRTCEEFALLLGAGSSALDMGLLHALEHTGTGNALPFIDRLANTTSSPEIRQKATSLMPLFLSRRNAELAAHSLLRGSSRPIASAVDLVRPVDYATTTTRHQLLRATQGNDGGHTSS